MNSPLSTEQVLSFKQAVLNDLNEVNIAVNLESGDEQKNIQYAAFMAYHAVRKTMHFCYMLKTHLPCSYWDLQCAVEYFQSADKQFYSEIPSIIKKNYKMYQSWCSQDFVGVKLPSKRSIIAVYNACKEWLKEKGV